MLLAKPFDPRELVFIVRGMLHGRARGGSPRRSSLSAGPVTLHALLNTATVAAREVDLTGAWSPFDRCLDTHINRLRRKIGEDRCGRTPIRTIRSIGYLMLADWEPRT